MAEIVSEKAVNEATEKEVRTRSTFDLNYDFYQTLRFGEYCPHYVLEGVDSDDLPLRSSHRLMSYTLQAPLLSDLKINKDYFYVPMQAILPLNWNKWYENPVIGQDCPNDCGPSVDGFWSKINSLFSTSYQSIGTYITSSGASMVTAYDRIFKLLVFFERIYSDGSLMANFGIHASQFYDFVFTSGSRAGDSISYDEWFDYVIGELRDSGQGALKYFTIQYGSDVSNYFIVDLDGRPGSNISRVITFRDFLELLRDDFSWSIISVNSDADDFQVLDGIWQSITGSVSLGLYTYQPGSAPDVPLDLRRLWAYQLVCWHFYSNDKVDYIYSAELFRQYILTLVTRSVSSGIYSNNMVVRYFTMNGMQYEYDALSARFCNYQIINFDNSLGIFGLDPSSSTSTADSLSEAYAYFRALFGFNSSLRFKDYFTGSRTRPLAVGSVDVQVNSNLVNVIDVTRNIQRQRFFNAINRLPHQIEDYLRGLFGKRPAPDYHNPFFLARTTDSVFGQESEYTGNVADAEANNITSVLRSNADKYCFEFSPDRDCVVIGITSFDLPRAYGSTIERQALHLTRFDGFNPYMQFIGDQEVYKAELGNDIQNHMVPFGYQLRHMEYKQRYSQASGAFRKFLPGYVFLADEGIRRWESVQSPEYIRSHNTELDRFYKSLTGYSLGSYFHFIVKNSNIQSASRPMAYAPSIL